MSSLEDEIRIVSTPETMPITEPQLYLLCGLQGTGKSTIGKLIAEKIGAQILKTDKIRTELFPNPQFTPEERQAVYDEMFRRATEQIQQGKRIILDATFLSQSKRARALEVAQETGVGFKIIKAEFNDEIARTRLDTRYGDDVSSATYEVYLREKNNFEPIVEEHVVIDNSGSLEELEATISHYFPDPTISEE